MWVGSLVVAIMDMAMHMKDITVTTQQQILLQGIMTDMDMSVSRQPAHKIREVQMQIVLKLKVAAAVDTTIEQILKTASITRVTHNMTMKNTTNRLVSLEVVGGRVAGHITCQTCLMDLLPPLLLCS
jgi:predicted acetyltransferase